MQTTTEFEAVIAGKITRQAVGSRPGVYRDSLTPLGIYMAREFLLLQTAKRGLGRQSRFAGVIKRTHTLDTLRALAYNLRDKAQ
jgi:hypothetical protein